MQSKDRKVQKQQQQQQQARARSPSGLLFGGGWASSSPNNRLRYGLAVAALAAVAVVVLCAVSSSSTLMGMGAGGGATGKGRMARQQDVGSSRSWVPSVVGKGWRGVQVSACGVFEFCAGRVGGRSLGVVGWLCGSIGFDLTEARLTD